MLERDGVGTETDARVKGRIWQGAVAPAFDSGGNGDGAAARFGAMAIYLRP